MAKGSKRVADEAKRALFKAASIGALGIYGTAYFVTLSFGAIAWMALAIAPWVVDASRLGDHAGVTGVWLLRAASILACASFAIPGRSIGREAAPMTARARPGGSWVAIALMSWLSWLDCSLRLGREPPACLGGAGWVAHDFKGMGRLAWDMVKGALDLPRRSLAICWGVVLIAAMPLGIYLAMAAYVPAVIMHILFPNGPGSSLLERTRIVASDFAKEGTQEWADSERAEIGKAVGAAIDERLALQAKAAKRAAKRMGRASQATDAAAVQESASSEPPASPERTKRL